MNRRHSLQRILETNGKAEPYRTVRRQSRAGWLDGELQKPVAARRHR
jgi:hypothetical protein